MSNGSSSSRGMAAPLMGMHDGSPLGTAAFPTPLSPPMSPLSKQVELARAAIARSNSNLFSISRDDFVYEDDSIIVVNKPPGIYCDSVLSSVQKLMNCSEDVGDPITQLHLANRLDRDTSGLMIITKFHQIASRLVAAFTDHKVKKTYLALSIAPAPKWEQISVKSGHGRSKFGAFRVYSALDIGRRLPGDSIVKDMVTSFEILSINKEGRLNRPNKSIEDEVNVRVIDNWAGRMNLWDDQGENEILIRAYPRSGRTHQIRLHCQYLGIPIRGDVKYQGVYEWNGRLYETHALHAETLSFHHPLTNLPIELWAPIPSWAAHAEL